MDVDRILNYALKKVNKTLRLKEFPHVTENGIWKTTEDGYWTGGFWIGLLWWMHEFTKDESYKEHAYYWLKLLEHRKNSRTFDLGFIFYPSYVLGYRITGDIKLKNIALEAANTQLKTFNEKLKFIYHEYENEGKNVGGMIIDIMPNLALLWWAYEETSNEKYYDIASRHSERTIEELIRKDGSTIQGLIFDLKNFEIIKKLTFQGVNVNSCWSRGQAWGILGFILAYNTTRIIKYLEVAKNLGIYFISNLPMDNVPCYDLNAEVSPNTLRDSSAAAIACSGLLDIYKHTNDKKFLNCALKILDSLSTNYLNNEYDDGILAHGCFYKQKNWAIDDSLIWGDYYLVEALMKVFLSRYDKK